MSKFWKNLTNFSTIRHSMHSCKLLFTVRRHNVRQCFGPLNDWLCLHHSLSISLILFSFFSLHELLHTICGPIEAWRRFFYCSAQSEQYSKVSSILMFESISWKSNVKMQNEPHELSPQRPTAIIPESFERWQWERLSTVTPNACSKWIHWLSPSRIMKWCENQRQSIWFTRTNRKWWTIMYRRRLQWTSFRHDTM